MSDIRRWTQFFIFIAFSTQAIAQSLPANMPPFTVTLNNSQADGHLFLTPLDITSPASNWPSTVLLLDEQGSPVFYMPISSSNVSPYPRKSIGNFQVHDNGLMSFTDALFGPDENIMIMDSTFTIIDTVTCTAPYKLAGHDFVMTDDGHYHLLAMEDRIMDMSAFLTETGPYGDTNCVVTGHIIQEFDENQVLVSEWKSLDYFALSDMYWYHIIIPSAVEHSHVNSLFVDHDGNYVISSRSLNEITRINRSTGEIMWRFGGKNNEFTIIGDTTQFTAQHDAQLLPDGRLVIFDNGTFTEPTQLARMVTYQMDTVAMTATTVDGHSHDNNFYSGFMGSARYVDPNHQLISWGGGYDYTVGTTIQEFDEFWNETMAVNFQDGFVSYRAIKSILPWSLDRPELICDGVNSTLTGPAGASSYLWSTGDTTQSITITATGIYQLWTEKGDGFMSSEPFEILDVNDICQTAGLEGFVSVGVTVYPNPAREKITVRLIGNTDEIVEISLIDLQGRLIQTKNVMPENSDITFNVSKLPTGLYRINLMNNNSKLVTTKLVNIMN
ncbi:MAG: hypothetical protein ACI865_000432 [Flavobacteriaceae bacterium]|jgi:hypothetical protein